MLVAVLGSCDRSLTYSLGRAHGSVRAEQEVNARIRHQVGLELVEVDVQSTLEAKGRSQRGGDLRDQSIQVEVRGLFNLQVLLANVVDGLVVEHEGAVHVFQERVRGEHRVVGLNDGGADLRRRVDAEVELGLLAKVHRESLHQQRSEAGSSAATDGVIQQETLKTVAVLGLLADTFQSRIDHFLANSVVTASVVVGGILFARKQRTRMEQLFVLTVANSVDSAGFQVDED